MAKKLKLELQKALLMHTIDFLIVNHTGYFVLDDHDSQKEYYLQEKKTIESYFAEGNLKKLNTLLATFQRNLYLKRDENYPSYIQGASGSPLKLYKELSKSIQRIHKNNRLITEEDVLEAEFLLKIYNLTNDYKDEIDKLSEYIEIYRKQSYKNVHRNILTNENNLNTTQLNDILSKSNPKRQNSQNGKNWLEINRSGKEDNELTYIVAGVDGSNGPIYSIKGRGEKIKFYWINDSTIVIHTSSNYETVLSTKILKTKQSKISIKYFFDS